ncbi:MAG: DeoR/GlpR family DNA-binding transcription regulator [Rhodobacteraceae bacterium]|nr:DeoR/GlpR family DNA-binding transcription regulator [Paracoccaceae bacterium]
MKDQDRLQAICRFVQDHAFASVRDLEAKLGVSKATIRRDIDKLSDLGRLRKVYGGVSRPSDTDHKLSASPYHENADIAVAAKTAIARAAARLVRDGDRIIVNGGSTCFAFGTHIAERPVTVYTNSMPLAAYLGDIGTCALRVAGGELHREPRILHDPETLTPFYASRLFTGVQGLSVDGLLESHPMLVQVARQLASWADELVLLADSRKFDIRPRHAALPLHRVHTLITDSGLRDQDAAMLEREGIRLIVADADP